MECGGPDRRGEGGKHGPGLLLGLGQRHLRAVTNPATELLYVGSALPGASWADIERRIGLSGRLIAVFEAPC